jgi:hypothetical protein
VERRETPHVGRLVTEYATPDLDPSVREKRVAATQDSDADYCCSGSCSTDEPLERDGAHEAGGSNNSEARYAIDGDSNAGQAILVQGSIVSGWCFADAPQELACRLAPYLEQCDEDGSLRDEEVADFTW